MNTQPIKLGRTPRGFDARIPHLSALIAGQTLPPIPTQYDWTKAGDMPAQLGMMCNDTLGDCTCAAVYHARQVWSANTSTMITEPDTDVQKLYQLACGWNPNQPGEGPGGNEQAVLTYLLNTGAPTGSTVDKISAFVEVDPRNLDDVKRTIYACGVAYIGFNVPAFLMPTGSPPPTTWTVQNTDTNIIGGHAVVLAGYTPESATVISWGQYYQMTWPFFSKYVDEVYAIADDEWFTAKGSDPLNLTLQQLEAQMRALKGK